MKRQFIAVVAASLAVSGVAQGQTTSLLRGPEQAAAPTKSQFVQGDPEMTLVAPANRGAYPSAYPSAARIAQVPRGATSPYAGQPGVTQPGLAQPGIGNRAGMATAPGAANPAATSPLTIAQASWTYRPPPPLRVFNTNDIVTIRVDEITRVAAEGAAESRKRTLYEAILTDWIRLDKFRLRPDPQLEGDPTVGNESNSNYRAEATVESRESLTFNIAAAIVDIRPNGILVLEGTKTIRVNDNLWETSLIGMCRAEDVAADNVVLSKDLIDLQIQKQDRGHLRDGYKRGWFQRWFDRVQPF